MLGNTEEEYKTTGPDVVPTQKKLRQEVLEFDASLDYMVRHPPQ